MTGAPADFDPAAHPGFALPSGHKAGSRATSEKRTRTHVWRPGPNANLSGSRMVKEAAWLERR